MPIKPNEPHDLDEGSPVHSKNSTVALVSFKDRRVAASGAFFLTWNPSRWPWIDLETHLAQVTCGQPVELNWSTGNTKKIEAGDRVFLLKQGELPRGIMASGLAISEVFEDAHHDAKRAAAGDKANYVRVRLDRLVRPEAVLAVEDIHEGPLAPIYWAMPASGIEMPSDAARELTLRWAAYQPPQTDDVRADELTPGRRYVEGAAKVVTVNRYERDKAATDACKAHWGTACAVCDFSFGKIYGKIGDGFIHVHHLLPLAAGDGEREVDPVQDLRPVCPNCHAMLHRSEPLLSIEELKACLKAR